MFLHDLISVIHLMSIPKESSMYTWNPQVYWFYTRFIFKFAAHSLETSVGRNYQRKMAYVRNHNILQQSSCIMLVVL